MKNVPTNETYSWTTSTTVKSASANSRAWAMIISLVVHATIPATCAGGAHIAMRRRVRHGDIDDARQQSFLALDRLFSSSRGTPAAGRTRTGTDSAFARQGSGALRNERGSQPAA